MKKLAGLILVTTFFLTSACTPTLTKEGNSVRKINLDHLKGCRHLGMVDGEWGQGWDYGDDIKGAHIMLRNKVAELGGDAFAVTDKHTSIWGTYVQADAYYCGHNSKNKKSAKSRTENSKNN